MTAIILAGGRSSRMGSDKAFLKIGGAVIIEREITALKKVFRDVVVVVSDSKKYDLKSVRIVEDIIKDYGPLGGLHAGLMASGTIKNFVTACDMPFLNEDVIRYVMGMSGGRDIVVPKIDGKLHPLFGVYSKACIPVIEEMVKEGLHRVSGLYDRLETRFISKKAIEKLDTEVKSIININTKEELSACLREEKTSLCRR